MSMEQVHLHGASCRMEKHLQKPRTHETSRISHFALFFLFFIIYFFFLQVAVWIWYVDEEKEKKKVGKMIIEINNVE